jgi:hypothetical protein
MMCARKVSTCLFAALVVLVAGACASSSQTSPAASAVTQPDVAMLAGSWQGFAKGTGGSMPVTVKVLPDGTYASTIGASSGNGTFSIQNGSIVTMGHLSGSAFGSEGRGTATLQQKKGRLTLLGEGRNDRGPYSYELVKN